MMAKGNGNALVLLAIGIGSLLALTFLFGAGFSCAFVQVRATKGDLLKILETSQQEAATATTLGILCDGSFYDLQDDPMWLYSRAFFFIALVFGGLAALVSVAVNAIIAPIRPIWQFISGSAALASLLQLPMFLIFETEPCTDYSMDQKCYLSGGSYLLIVSTFCWIFVTLITQIYDPPEWACNLDLWLVRKNNTSLAARDGLAHGRASSMESTSESSSFAQKIGCWHPKQRSSSDVEEAIDVWTGRDRGSPTVLPRELFEEILPNTQTQRFLESYGLEQRKINAANENVGRISPHDGPARQSNHMSKAPSSGSGSAESIYAYGSLLDEDEYVENSLTLEENASGISPLHQLPAQRQSFVSIYALYDELRQPEKLTNHEKVQAMKYNLDLARRAKEEHGSIRSVSKKSSDLIIVGLSSSESQSSDNDAGRSVDGEFTAPASESMMNRTFSSYGSPCADDVYLGLDEEDRAFNQSRGRNDPPAQRREVSNSGSVDVESQVESLGSLVSKEDGEESLLDKTLSTDGKDVDELDEKPLLREHDDTTSRDKTNDSPVRGNTVLPNVAQRLMLSLNRAQNTKGYLRMSDDDYDDNDADSLPHSPPVEIVTVNLEQHDDFQFIAMGSTPEEDELLEDWNRLHQVVTPLDGDSSEDSQIDRPPERDETLSATEFVDQIQYAESEGIDGSENIPRHNKRRKIHRKRKFGSSRSVTSVSVKSGTSLLDQTIEEETPEDLICEMEVDQATDFDPYGNSRSLQRTYSAPNLERLHPEMMSEPQTKLSEEVRVSGIHSSNCVYTWRGHSPNRPAKPPLSGRRHRSVSPQSVKSNPETNALKGSWFVSQVEEIADGAVDTNGIRESTEGTVATRSPMSRLSMKAREARLKRLAMTRGRDIITSRKHNLKPQELGVTEANKSNAFTPAYVSESEESEQEDSSFELTKLDLDLVEMQRPIDAEYGPEEVSL